MKQLYFMRHAESEFNRSDRWAGTTDSPLTDTGHLQAIEAGSKIREQGLTFDVIISSPLIRAHQTAKHVAEQIDYPTDDIVIFETLVERNFGALEGQRHLVAATQYLLDESAIDGYENVEPLATLHDRVVKVLEHLQTLPHESILVVGHGAFGRALHRHVNNQPLHKRGKTYDNAEFERLL